MKDSIVELHKLPLACDIITDDVKWSAKQSIKVESLGCNKIFCLDTTELPIASVNKSSKVHKSWRELIDKIKVNESLTIDFNAYGLTIDKVATYSAIAKSIITPIVTINCYISIFAYKINITQKTWTIISCFFYT